ncbi:NADdependent malic enzyme [Phytophthora megakarya]|uniref:NADdependent malic enzyme n=1 Tax=Phytophthora megakarya TaxID=4795 RepID=A0A225WWR4_9STRA|nr:NADdependent malic enzyme [Phytophthora megakarya]
MTGELLFSGELLAVTDADHVQIQKEAISFLQRLAEPVLVVSFHGARDSGKTALIQSLLGLEDTTEFDGAWLYVKSANFPNAKYLAILNRPGFGNTQMDLLMYSILAGLSSVVVHHVDGHLTPEAVDSFAFLASNQGENDAPPAYTFPQSPKLLWVLQNVTTSELKEQVQESGLSLQETEQTYLCNALAALPEDSPAARFSKLFENVFPDQGCFAVPPRESNAFEKRIDKLSRVFTDSIHNRYLKGVVLNGPLIGSIVVSMLAHRDNVFTAFRGRIWKDSIHNCCLNVVENGVKLYKLRMSERLGNIVDTSDLKGFKPALATAQENSELVEKLFRDLVESVFTTIQEENNRISSEIFNTIQGKQCFSVLLRSTNTNFFAMMCDDENSYSFQSTQFKRFFHQYQTYMFELMAEYTDQAKGPVKKEELVKFMHNTIRPQLADFSEKLDKIRQHDVDVVDEQIEKKEEEVEEFTRKQKVYQKQAGDVQEEVNRQLIEGAKLQSLRKEALVGAINDLARMHAMAAKQKELLEEAAFVSVQLPEQKVIEAAQEKEEVTELQGYLIKQGGGGNVFNPLGRKNWKQRYFILIGANLIYASTKDDYERGKIIKELCLTGCKIDPSRDAGEGFDITPGKSAHVFELQRGFFEKNSKKRSSAADSGRVFKLRAQNIQERDVWIDKLRQAAGGY